MARRVVQDPEKPVEPEILADAIVRIADGMQRLAASKLNQRAIIVLVQDRTGIGRGAIKTVLDGLEELAHHYAPKTGRKAR